MLLILNSHHGNTKKKSKGKGLYLHEISIRWRRRLLVEVLRVEERRVRRGRVSFTQYLESQEDQDMTRLLNFTRTQERRREWGFLCVSGMNEMESIYSSGGGNMNEMSFNEG